MKSKQAVSDEWLGHFPNIEKLDDKTRASLESKDQPSESGKDCYEQKH